MNKILYLLFLSLFFVEHLHYTLEMTPRFTTWFPEALAILICLIVCLKIAVDKKMRMGTEYLCLFLFYLIVILIGAVLNGVSLGAAFVGIRVYLKYIPFFLLPAVYSFSEKEFRNQLIFLLPFLLLQCPLAVYQRLFKHKGVLTGDVITGTLRLSGTLSIVMICSISVLFALYLKKKISLKFFVVMACCLFLPTTLNETKATLVLFPIALALPVLLISKSGFSVKLKNAFIMALVCVLFITAFIPIYDHFMKPRAGYGLIDYIKMEGEGRGYLYTGAKGKKDEVIGRGDAIVLAYKNLSKDVLKLTFGLGMGNVMGTYFDAFRGKHADKVQYHGEGLALTYLMWELGLAGALVYMSFFFFLFRDTLLLRQSDDLFGSFSLGWSAVLIVMFISIAYTNMIRINVLNLMFWYFSGIVSSNAFGIRSLSRKRPARRSNEIRFLKPYNVTG